MRTPNRVVSDGSNRLRRRRSPQRVSLLAHGHIAPVVLLLLSTLACQAAARETNQRPPLKKIKAIVRAKLNEREEYKPGHLLSREDVKRVLQGLAAAGCQPPDAREILAAALPENAPLVRILSTKSGVKFMGKVKSFELIYDRMDRVSRVSGGKQMLRDIAKLPDGEKLAKVDRPRGVPGFLELLPKNSSGKTRTIKDYKKPTGLIYTEKQLLKRLQQSYEDKSEKNEESA